MLSFSRLVKEELLNNDSQNDSKELVDVQMAAILHSIATISFNEEDVQLELRSNNSILIRNIVKKLKKYYSYIEYRILVRENRNFHKKQRRYIIRFDNNAIRFMNEIGVFEGERIGILFHFDFPKLITKDDHTYKEYLKYFFICNGSINDPKIQKQYHLELGNNKVELLERLQKLTKKYGINFKITTRKNTSALYLNKGEEISDFLKLIGSVKYLFQFEDYRLFRDFRAAENRLINAEVANFSKVQQSAQKQIRAIEKIKEAGNWESLKDKTQMVGKLRMENPHASLAELVDLADEKISKSNIRHHLNLILKCVEE